MGEHNGLDFQIRELKRQLERTAELHHFNFLHPKVIALSQRLDFLIVQFMKRPVA
jgi:hypothetical protein